MNTADILALYEQVLQFSGRMLEAARSSDWSGLLQLEQKRGEVLASVMRLDRGEPVEPALAARKTNLIRAILSADTETKVLTESWMQELQGILGSIGTERKLSQVYGTP